MPVDAVRHAQHARSSAADVDGRVPAVGDDDAPADHDVVDVGCRRPRTPPCRGRARPRPAVRTESRRTVVRSARAPGVDAAAVGPPEAGMTVVSSPSRSSDGRVVAAHARRSPAARRARRPGPPRGGRSRRGSRCRASGRAPASRSSSRRPDAVGEVALRGRAEAARAAGATEQAEVRAGDVRGVHRREPLAQGAGVGEQLGRREAELGHAPARSRPAAPTRGRAARRRARRPTRDDLDAGRVDGAHGVDRRADSHAVAVLQSPCSRRPTPAASPSEKRRWAGVELDADAALQVAGVEQGDAQAGFAQRRRSTRRPSRSASSYGTPPGPWWR